MLNVFINDLFEKYQIEKNEVNIMAVKSLIRVLCKNNNANLCHQKLEIDEKIFSELWLIYVLSMREFFDNNYNRKSDFYLYFDHLYNSVYNGKKLNMLSLFCPGYTKNGYKKYFGHTNSWKIKSLAELEKFYKECKVDSKIYNYYSDVFLENTDYNLNPNWEKELEENKKIFSAYAQNFFPKSQILYASQIPVFSTDDCIEGYIDSEKVKSLPLKIYKSILLSNKRFYDKLNFSDDMIKFRNDRLITMYRILSDYLNENVDNSIFLPMENMYERENVFSINNTCTLYLKLKE